MTDDNFLMKTNHIIPAGESAPPREGARPVRVRAAAGPVQPGHRAHPGGPTHHHYPPEMPACYQTDSCHRHSFLCVWPCSTRPSQFARFSRRGSSIRQSLLTSPFTSAPPPPLRPSALAGARGHRRRRGNPHSVGVRHPGGGGVPASALRGLRRRAGGAAGRRRRRRRREQQREPPADQPGRRRERGGRGCGRGCGGRGACAGHREALRHCEGAQWCAMRTLLSWAAASVYPFSRSIVPRIAQAVSL